MSIIERLKKIIQGRSKNENVVQMESDLDNSNQYAKTRRHRKEGANCNDGKYSYNGSEARSNKGSQNRHYKSFKNNKRKGYRNYRRYNDLGNINSDSVKFDFGSWTVDAFQVEKVEGKLRFHDLDLSDRLMRGICESGYKYCTPIQSLILPHACQGRDVSGKAQTGTGKTAAFLVTVFKRLMNNSIENQKAGTPRVLVMAPTRELVIQIEKDARSIGKYCNLNIQSVFGGINYEKQRRQLEGKIVDILVATPGRLLDYQEQGVLDLGQVEILVIDEADRMLDMGFIPDMKKIIRATPSKGKRQTLLFSATLTNDIIRLASSWTKDSLSFEVEAKELTSENIEQLAYIASNKEKFAIMYNIISTNRLNRTIIFGNRRDEVSILADMFKACGIACGVLSGDITQAKRIKTLDDLRLGKIQVLCATDVAARGIHINGITHVFNFSLPDDPEDYVHRIGRTGRAGEEGTSIIFATEEDSYLIPKIESFTKRKLNYINPDEDLVTLPEEIIDIIKGFKPIKVRDSNFNRRRNSMERHKGSSSKRSMGGRHRYGKKMR